MATTKELTVTGIRQRFESMTRSTGSESDSTPKRCQPPRPKPKPKSSTGNVGKFPDDDEDVVTSCSLSMTSSNDATFDSKQASVDSLEEMNAHSIGSGKIKATFSSQSSKSSTGVGVGDEVENEVFESARGQSADTPPCKSADTPTNGTRPKFKLPPPPPARTTSKARLTQLKRQDVTMTSSCDHLPDTAGKDDDVTLTRPVKASYEDGDLDIDKKGRPETVAETVSKWSSTPSLPHNSHDATSGDVKDRAKQKKTLDRIAEVRRASQVLSSSSDAVVDTERPSYQTETRGGLDLGSVSSEASASHVTGRTGEVTQSRTATLPAACPVPAPRLSLSQKKPRPPSIFPPDAPERLETSSSLELGLSTKGEHPSRADPPPTIVNVVTNGDTEIYSDSHPPSEPPRLTSPTRPTFQQDVVCPEEVCERSKPTSDERKTGDVIQPEPAQQPEETKKKKVPTATLR